MDVSSVAEIQEHQLDYDWRFVPSSVEKLVSFVEQSNTVLLLGCPSLVITLCELSRRGVLVERNPNRHGIKNKFGVVHRDLRFDASILGSGPFDVCVADPPWYPLELLHWMSFGLSNLRIGGSLFFTLWPEAVRPTAAVEHQKILAQASRLGKVDRLGEVEYALPAFELASSHAVGDVPGKRKGLLFRITKDRSETLAVPPFRETPERWLRFTLSAEQLAIRVGSHDGYFAAGLFAIPPFTLRSTSRRDDVLASINIWTSRNCVARLNRPAEFADRLSSCDVEAIRVLTEQMNMAFDPKDVQWGISWQHQA